MLRRVQSEAGFQEVLAVCSAMLHSGIALWQTPDAASPPQVILDGDSTDIIGRCIVSMLVPALVASVTALDEDDDASWKKQFDDVAKLRETMVSLKGRVEDAVSHGWQIEKCMPALIDDVASALSRQGSDALLRVTKGRKDAVAALESLAQKKPLDKLMDEIARVEIGKARARQLFVMCCEPSSASFCAEYRRFRRLDMAMTAMRQHDLIKHLVAESADDADMDISQDTMSKMRTICGCLSAMVALWRSLKPGENRASIAANALASLSDYDIATQLTKLLSQASQGHTAYVPT